MGPLVAPLISSRLSQDRLNAAAFPHQCRSRGKSADHPRRRGAVRRVRAWKAAIDRLEARRLSPAGHARCIPVALERRDDGAAFDMTYRSDMFPDYLWEAGNWAEAER